MHDEVKGKITTFFHHFSPQVYERNEIIIHPDEQIKGAYFIESGSVREYSISPDGVELTLHVFVPGSFFPMTHVISHIPNRYYYEAVQETKVYTAPSEQVTDFLKNNPDVLFSLTGRLLVGMDKLLLRMESMVFGNASQKLISIILYLVRHFGKEKDGGFLIEEIFTHRSIGTLAGISRETTSRAFEKLEKKGIILYKNQHIFVPSLEKLQTELSQEISI
jgi:CRP-like cAMP-binding protein